MIFYSLKMNRLKNVSKWIDKEFVEIDRQGICMDTGYVDRKLAIVSR